MRAQPTTPYLRLRLRSLAEAIDDIAAGKDSRVLFDDEPVEARCKNASCNFPLVTWSERASGECWCCARERSG